MYRIRKLLWMIFIFWMVFFIICDEKWYRIWYENNQIIFNKIEKKSGSIQFNPNAVYKNSNLININYEFENPRNLRKSDWLDSKHIAKLEKEKKLEEEKIRAQEKMRENNRTFEDDTILSAFQWWEWKVNTWKAKKETNQKTWVTKKESTETAKKEIEQGIETTKEKTKESTKNSEDIKKTSEEKTKQNTDTVKKQIKEDSESEKEKTKEDNWTTKKETKETTGDVKVEKKTKEKGTSQNTWTVKKEETDVIKKDVKNNTNTANKNSKWNTWKVSNSENKSWATKKVDTPKPVVVYYPVKKYEHSGHSLNLSKWAEIPKVKIERYTWRKILVIKLSKGKQPGPLYKNSNRIKIYSWFENPIALRNSAGIDEEFLMRQKNSKPTIISLNDNDTISSARQNNLDNKEKDINSLSDEQNDIESDLFDTDEKSNTDTWMRDSGYNVIDAEKDDNWTIQENIEENINDKDLENSDSQRGLQKEWTKIETLDINEEDLKNEITYKVKRYKKQHESVSLSKWEESEKTLVKVDRYEPESHSVNIKNWVIEENYISVEKPEISIHSSNLSKWEESEKALVKVDRYEPESHSVNIKNWVIEENYISVEKPEISVHSPNLSKWKELEIILVKVEKYNLNKHSNTLKKWKAIEHDFIVENTEIEEQTDNWLSDAMLDSLLENEEIDINTLESENDEFLQKVFEQTKDIDVMNLIVETYLNEYQFVKAKNFVENLPDIYRQDLKPSLNLRVGFNSFPLSSKTINENLNELVQNYSSKNEITDEDEKRYLWVIALMDRNYDRFFEIATWFTSEKNIWFTSKLQWYKNQIAKQMWMPDYYFDTLVALELFNQWLFQPAKVLALYSLQQNSSYILPYQVLAYANFLTNSRDTSTEYLKKLVDLDPNNAEKYRFLMWVAFYRDEKYEQSVVMLSMIKDESLRLDTQRYLINDYLKLDQKNKLISSRNKLLWYENLVASDFYTYFYETFFHPYSQWEQFKLYAYDTDLANKMLRVCSITLQREEKAVCTYWTIGRNIAMWQFDGLEQYLLNLATEYPQWYLYQALWDYYIQQWDLEKAKAYLIKAISLTQKKSERSQIKKLLQDTMQ